MKRVFALLFCFLGMNTFAQTTDEKLEALIEEFADLKAQLSVKESEDVVLGQQHHGMGTSASKVYFSKSALSIGGYGEVIFENIQGETGDTADALRFVPYIGYRFSDKIILNAEIEIEHADEIFMEFAYVDFLLDERLNIRTGLVLIPFGITNLQHEPTLFPSVSRPEIEQNIIPTTWRENGGHVYGKWSDIYYSLGLVNGFDAASFSSSSWVRGGRQKGSQAKADNWASIARIGWKGYLGLDIGFSGYSGRASQDAVNVGDARVNLWEGHAVYETHNMKFKALYVEGSLSDSARVSASNGNVVGSRVKGYYLEGQYNFLPLITPETKQSMHAFIRYSEYDTHDEVDPTLVRDQTLNRTRTTVGLTYNPDPRVVVKADWKFRKNKVANESDILGLGVGYIF